MFGLGGGAGRDAQLQANRERAYQASVKARESEHQAFMICNKALFELNSSMRQIGEGIAGSCNAGRVG
jgi:ubiquitin